MNKKFLSVVLATGVVLAPVGGNYCFAEDRDNCLSKLNKCLYQNMENAITLNKKRNLTEADKKDIMLAYPESVFENADNCYDTLKECESKNARLKEELSKFRREDWLLFGLLTEMMVVVSVAFFCPCEETF